MFQILVLAGALIAPPLSALTLDDFRFGREPRGEIDPLSRVPECEDHLKAGWPTAAQYAAFEDFVGESLVYIGDWVEAEDGVAFVRENEDRAVDLLTRGFDFRRTLDFEPATMDGEGQANVLESVLLELETINFFLGYTASIDELEALQAEIERDLASDDPTPELFARLRHEIGVITQQEILSKLRVKKGDVYRFPTALWDRWTHVFRKSSAT